jgi:hypothetical protein
LTLFEKAHAIDVSTSGSTVGIVIAGDNHDADFLDACRQHLFNDDLQSGLVDPIAIHEGLQRESALLSSCRGDNGFAKVHGRAVSELPKVSRPTHERDHADCFTRRFDSAEVRWKLNGNTKTRQYENTKKAKEEGNVSNQTRLVLASMIFFVFSYCRVFVFLFSIP